MTNIIANIMANIMANIIPRSWEWYKIVYRYIPENELRELYEEQTGKKITEDN